jgi:hypothetical protein
MVSIGAGLWVSWRMWRRLRALYHGMLDDLEAVALMHLQMLEHGIESPDEVDHQFTEFADRFDARIREAFKAQKLPPIDLSRFKE